MRSLLTRKIFGMTLASSLLSACGLGTSGSVPNAQPAFQGAAGRLGDAAKGPYLSGEYKGTFTDGAYGKGKAEASYAQYQSGVGGILSIKYANATVTASVALVANGTSLDGNTVAGGGSTYCTFSTTSTYDAATKIMSGSYTAVAGCTGDAGTFRLRHLCTYKGNAATDLRPQIVPHPC